LTLQGGTGLPSPYKITAFQVPGNASFIAVSGIVSQRRIVFEVPSEKSAIVSPFEPVSNIPPFSTGAPLRMCVPTIAF
jgi:hypothetical protein